MEEVSQDEMYKSFSDYLELLKENFRHFSDEYPDDVREAFQIAITAYEVIADSEVGDQNIREDIFARVPQEKLEWASKVIEQWRPPKKTKPGQGACESIYKDINGVETLVSIDRQRGFELETPLPKTDFVERFTKLFPSKKISLLDVFNSINEATNFLDAFVPFDFHYRAEKPESIYFYAALIERTTRNSFKRIVKKVGDIEKETLDETSRIFLTLDNVRSANNRVVGFIDDMEISSIPETGFDPYHFEDKNDLVSRPTAVCCSEIEFPYAIDSLIGNASAPIEEDYVLIEDKMACRELLCGIADLLGYTYVNRITDFGYYKIYVNEDYDGKDLKPDAMINSDLITENWDEMLRFVATIKTGYTPASVIIPKLWNRFEDPMFIGLRELGRMCQSIFILKYIDSLELRQTIERHLHKAAIHAELSTFVQKPQGANEFIPYQDRELNAACATLLKNCIMAWNWLHLSEIKKSTDDFEPILKHGFVPVWKHIYAVK